MERKRPRPGEMPLPHSHSIRHRNSAITIAAPPSVSQSFADYEWQIKGSWPDAVTWRLENSTRGAYFLKVTASRRYPGALDECERMKWARQFLPVPNVVECGSENDVEWLAMHALPGADATDPALMSKPAELTRLLAEGLRRFHRAPVADCPFDFTIDAAMDHVRRRADGGLIDPARDFHPEHSHLTVEAAITELQRLRPESEDLAVCHGDYCLPNILVANGAASGFVDLGELGVADRWWDLAVATWSLTWNLGRGWEDLFLETYSAARDEQRIAFYRLLYDLAS